MGDVGNAYAETRERISALVRSADTDARVPGCPSWTVKDVRGALGQPGARDSAAVEIAISFAGPVIAATARERGLPAICLRTTSGAEWSGGDDPVATLTADPFDLMRSASGRRSLDEIRSLKWESDPEAVIDVFTFGPFTPPEEPLEE